MKSLQRELFQSVAHQDDCFIEGQGVYTPLSGRTEHPEEFVVRIQELKAHSLLLLSLLDKILYKVVNDYFWVAVEAEEVVHDKVHL